MRIRPDTNDLLSLIDFQSERARIVDARLSLREKIIKAETEPVPLLVHEQIIPSENMESFLYRSATRNGLKSAAELARALHLPDNKPMSYRRNEQISLSLGAMQQAIADLLPTATQEGSIRYGGHLVPRCHLAIGGSRLCPLCLQEKQHGKAHWNIAPLAVCEAHGVYLIDHCSCNADSPLSPTRPGYCLCTCGRDLRHHPVVKASRAGKQLAMKVFLGFSQTKDMRNLYSTEGNVSCETSFLGVLDLIYFLGALNTDVRTMNLALANPVIRMKPVIRRFEQSAAALMEEDGMCALLRRVSRPAGKKRSVGKAYEALRHVTVAAERYLSPELNKWFLAMVGRYLEDRKAWG